MKEVIGLEGSLRRVDMVRIEGSEIRVKEGRTSSASGQLGGIMNRAGIQRVSM